MTSPIIMRNNTSKTIIISFFIIIILITIIQLKDQSIAKLSPSKLLNQKDKIVSLISQYRSKDKSLYGLKYRSMICSIVRNDPHLLEFLLRHLILGISHIVIYDNNRILSGHDMNITNVLQPFISAGFVTHISWEQNKTDFLPNGNKNGNSQECLDKYGVNADWVTVLDTDEYFYYEYKNNSFHSLNHLLVELENNSLCAISIFWIMMYGEGIMLKQNKTLFESYPRICQTTGQTKILARLKHTIYDIPHNAQCNTKNFSAKSWSSNQYSKIGLVHYYSKSMEEFILKGDQSIPPYIRNPILTYQHSGNVCNKNKFIYSEDYRRIFINLYEQFERISSLKIIYLLPPPSLNVKQMPDYSLFIHLKYRCAKKEEFDNEKYLKINPEAKTLIENGTFIDGLHHFMEYFMKGIKGCWKNDFYSICE